MGKQLAADLSKAFGTGLPSKPSTKLIGRPPNPTTVLIAPRKRAYDVREAAEELSISVAHLYVLLARGELRGKKMSSGKRMDGSKKAGRLVILGEELDRYLAACPDAKFNMPSVTGGADSQKATTREAIESGRTADKRTGKHRGEATARVGASG